MLAIQKEGGLCVMLVVLGSDCKGIGVIQYSASIYEGCFN
jgi:hypothetical protein